MKYVVDKRDAYYHAYMHIFSLIQTSFYKPLLPEDWPTKIDLEDFDAQRMWIAYSELFDFYMDLVSKK